MLATTEPPFRTPANTEIQLNAVRAKLDLLRIEINHHEQMHSMAIEHLQWMIAAIEIHHRMDLLEARQHLALSSNLEPRPSALASHLRK